MKAKHCICPSCDNQLPWRARYFQYFTCKKCNTILVTGKELGTAFDLKLYAGLLVVLPILAAPTKKLLWVICFFALALWLIWVAFNPPAFRVKGPAFVPPPKEKVDVAGNIKKYKEEQARKKASRKWL